MKPQWKKLRIGSKTFLTCAAIAVVAAPKIHTTKNRFGTISMRESVIRYLRIKKIRRKRGTLNFNHIMIIALYKRKNQEKVVKLKLKKRKRKVKNNKKNHLTPKKLTRNLASEMNLRKI
jgi:copper(I)-binding protein